jgi:hypothetical protein
MNNAGPSRQVTSGATCLMVALALLFAAGCSRGHSGSDTPVKLAPDYTLVFNRSVVDEYELVFTTVNWQALQNDPFTYVPATVKYKDETYLNVGVRYKGNSSFHAVPPPKKPFKVDFDRYEADQNFHGVKKLNFSNSLWDPTLMREMHAYDTFAAAGCPASRTSHVKLCVTVPGIYTHECFGVYIMIEQVDKTYLADRFPDNDGNLYKAAMWGGDLKWYGSDPSAYWDCYEKKTNEIENDWSDLVNFLNVLNNTPEPTFKAQLESVFNVDGFLSYLAANTVLSNLDSIAGRNCNFYLYNNPVTGRFEFIPWDLNEAFGNHTLPRDNGLTADEMLTFDIYNPVSTGEHVLIERILTVPEYVDTYLSRVRALVEGQFSPAQLHAKIDSTYNLIKTDVHADIYKEFSSSDFDLSIVQDLPEGSDPARILGIKPFVSDRVTNILNQLGP